jgi:hypothetical protein
MASSLPGTPQHYALVHWCILCFYNILPCYHPLLCSKYHSRKHAFGARKFENAANFGHKNKTALFAEDTSGSKFEAPILRPRKRLLHGTNFYCLGLALAAHRDSKVSPSHFSIRVLEVFSPHSHTHSVYIYNVL